MCDYGLRSLSSSSVASVIGDDKPCPPAEAFRPGAAILLPLCRISTSFSPLVPNAIVLLLALSGRSRSPSPSTDSRGSDLPSSDPFPSSPLVLARVILGSSCPLGNGPLLCPVMTVPSFVCGIAIARGSERAFRSFSSTEIVFFVRTLPCQIKIAALPLARARPGTYPIPQRNERGIRDPVVHAGRSCLSVLSADMRGIRLT
jgi:hypothetical protein